MSVTDLLARIPFSPTRGQEPEARPSDVGPPRTFAVETPAAEAAGGRKDLAFVARPRPAPVAVPPPPPLPSWAALVIGGLMLVSIALATALVAVALQGDPHAVGRESIYEIVPLASATPTFPAPATSIPIDMLTQLEAVGQEPIEVELAHLLDAIGHGFGQRSARLEPTLQSYVYRMSSRFEWSPDSFRVAVTAPDADLAAARGDLLERLFANAVTAGRLRVGTGTGPHSLTLVSPTNE